MRNEGQDCIRIQSFFLYSTSSQLGTTTKVTSAAVLAVREKSLCNTLKTMKMVHLYVPRLFCAKRRLTLHKDLQTNISIAINNNSRRNSSSDISRQREKPIICNTLKIIKMLCSIKSYFVEMKAINIALGYIKSFCIVVNLGQQKEQHQ